MLTPQWSSRTEWEIWWRNNVIALNRLAVTDPEEYERVCQACEKFNRENPWTRRIET